MFYSIWWQQQYAFYPAAWFIPTCKTRVCTRDVGQRPQSPLRSNPQAPTALGNTAGMYSGVSWRPRVSSSCFSTRKEAGVSANKKKRRQRFSFALEHPTMLRPRLACTPSGEGRAGEIVLPAVFSVGVVFRRIKVGCLCVLHRALRRAVCDSLEKFRHPCR